MAGAGRVPDPVVAALSGRPPRPQPAHRFAAVGGVLLAAGLVLLAFADQRRAGFIIGGTVATVVGLLSWPPWPSGPLRPRGPPTIAVRLALRDLARYQARSGAALGAATLAIGIAATIAISAAAAQTPPVPNLPADQLILYVTRPAGTHPARRPAASGAGQGRSTGHRHPCRPCSLSKWPTTPQPALNTAQSGRSGRPVPVTMAQVTATPGTGGESGRHPVCRHASPAGPLRHQPQPASGPDRRHHHLPDDLWAIADLPPVFPAGRGRPERSPGPPYPPRAGNCRRHPDIQILNQLPVTSDPNALITSHAMQTLGFQRLPAGWLIQTAASDHRPDRHGPKEQPRRPLRRNKHPQVAAALRNWSTAAGILLALGVLGMTVGLIRSETANDLRTLTATGASSTTDAPSPAPPPAPWLSLAPCSERPAPTPPSWPGTAATSPLTTSLSSTSSSSSSPYRSSPRWRLAARGTGTAGHRQTTPRIAPPRREVRAQ